MKEARSGIINENIQEVLDAEDSAKWALLALQQQYQTPEHLVNEACRHLPRQQIKNIFDPQCAKGNLLQYHGQGWPTKFGVELDNRIEHLPGVHLINADCQKLFDLIDDIAPDTRFDTFNANPPFGKRWGGQSGNVIDSSDYTWKRALKHGCQGVFITNHNTAVKLGIDKHPYTVRYTTHENVWKNCDVVVGVAVWRNPEAVPDDNYGLIRFFDQARQIIDEEKSARPPFNIWLNKDGKLATYLSTRSTVKHKLTRDEILKLHQIKNSHPLALTTERETRKLLRELVDCGFYTVEPKALKAIEDALAQVNMLACPLMPITDFESVAYADEEDHLECYASAGMDFTPGRKYEITTASYSFTEHFKRDKVHYDENTGQTYTTKHECTLSGQDRYILVFDDQRIARRFMDKPRKVHNEHDESLLWQIFKRPNVKTVADLNRDLVESNKKLLRTCEMLAGYEYYEGQIEYLSRVLVKDQALIGAAVGTGKTLMAITLIATKAPERALICAPQGTMRSSGDEEDEAEYHASQWITELRRFSPYLQVFELFSMADYRRIKAMNGGVLPQGVYVTYYQALFQNGARESCPASWDDTDLEREYPEFTVPKDPNGSTDSIVSSIGKEKRGIRCIVEPSMSTLIGDQFDMVLLDEAHYVCKSSANMTQIMLRLQPKYRYALTATPIPNTVIDMFNLMGWLCVEGWFRDDMRNAAWPYARSEIGRFEATFLSKERDLTQEKIRRSAEPQWRGKCEKPSPVISSPARLLKIIRPTLAFISKESVNVKYRSSKVIDIRVPMGKQQAKLYGHFLNRGNIPCRHPLVRARKQIAYLRAICADPEGFDHHTSGSPKVLSNFNPKAIAILELIAEILARNEQVVVVCSRVGQTNSFARRLEQCGIKYSRIDSTIPPDQHSAQSNMFKSGKTQVHLMGIKCAVAHSYPDCPNMIIGSLEYSFGSFEQAKGRVDRVNSKKPATIYCVLNQNSLEETMYDVVASKEDAAVICLRGKRLPRTFKPVDMGEVLAQSMARFSAGNLPDEMDLEEKWPTLQRRLKSA